MSVADEIIDRMKILVGEKADTTFSEKLGKSKGVAKTWRARGTIPINEILILSLKHNASLDWLLTGKGLMYRTEASQELVDCESEAVEEVKEYMEALLDDPEVETFGEDDIEVSFDEQIETEFLTFVSNLAVKSFNSTGKTDSSGLVVDIDTIQLIIEEMEKYLLEENYQPSPETKARQVKKMYQSFLNEGKKPSREEVRNLVLQVV